MRFFHQIRMSQLANWRRDSRLSPLNFFARLRWLPLFLAIGSLLGLGAVPGFAQVALQSSDIGAVGFAGSTTLGANGVYTVTGSGADVWGTADAFHFSSVSITGNFILVTQVQSVSVTSSWVKAGLMVRNDNTVGSVNSFLAISAGNGLTFQDRVSANASSTNVAIAGKSPVWLKLVRAGNVLTGFQSSDGNTWTSAGTQTINSLAATVQVGLALTSHNNTLLATALFNNFQLIPVSTPPAVGSPSAPTAAVVSDTQINLTWTAVNSLSGINHYNILRNGQLVGTSTGTTFSDIQLLASTGYYYTIQAVDAFNNVSGSSPSTLATTNPPTLYVPWKHADIGAVNLGGSSVTVGSSGIYTVTGAGADIYGTADAFQFAAQPVSGDFALVARVDSQTGSNSWAKAGLMIRNDFTPGSVNAAVLISPVGVLSCQSRLTTSTSTSAPQVKNVSVPLWLKLVRVGNMVSQYQSPDGVAWVLGRSQTLSSLASTAQVGLAVTNHDASKLSTAVFSSVQLFGPSLPQTIRAPSGLQASAITDAGLMLSWQPVVALFGIDHYIVSRNGVVIGNSSGTTWLDQQLTASTAYQYTVQAVDPHGYTSGASLALSVTTATATLPAPWQHSDVGAVGVGGSATTNSSAGTFTLSGAGSDIQGATDSFQFAWQSLSGDGQIVARLTGLVNSNGSTKAGVMFRSSLDPGSINTFVGLTPGANGAIFQARFGLANSTGADSTGVVTAAPLWVRLVRTGSTVYGSYSSDGQNWFQLGETSISLGNPLLVGLAVCSHSNATLCQATFDQVTVSKTVPADNQPPSVPTGLTVSAQTDTQAVLQWKTASDQLAVNAYNIYRNGVLVGTTAGTVFVDSGLQPGTAYTYAVTSVNAKGLESANTSTVAVKSAVSSLPLPWTHLDLGLIPVTRPRGCRNYHRTGDFHGPDCLGPCSRRG